MGDNRQENVLRELYEQLVKVFKQNPENSKGTRRDRQTDLRQSVRLLCEKFGLQRLRNMKPKHVQALRQEWQTRGLVPGTQQNKMANLRWLMEKLGKTRMLAKSNAEAGIEKRARHGRAGKYLPPEKIMTVLDKLSGAKDKALVLMARQFGMRFREASLFRPNRDVQGNMLWIKRGGKGGRPRYLWLVRPQQHELLEALRKMVTGRNGNLVDPDKTWEQWRQSAYDRLRSAGLSRRQDEVFHDLRRTWADEEFKRLREKGHSIREAAHIVAKRLGHNRIEVLRWYLPGAAA